MCIKVSLGFGGLSPAPAAPSCPCSLGDTPRSCSPILSLLIFGTPPSCPCSLWDTPSPALSLLIFGTPQPSPVPPLCRVLGVVVALVSPGEAEGSLFLSVLPELNIQSSSWAGAGAGPVTSVTLARCARSPRHPRHLPARGGHSPAGATRLNNSPFSVCSAC